MYEQRSFDLRIVTSVISVFITLIFLSSFAKAQTEKLDNLAACAEVFSGGYQQDDLQVADKILGGNVDKIINAHNTENFTADVYEEVVACYRALSKQLIEGAETIINNQSKWNDLKNTSIETLKRMLRAG